MHGRKRSRPTQQREEADQQQALGRIGGERKEKYFSKFSFLFSFFLLLQSHFKFIFHKHFECFQLESNPHNSKKQMHRHVCTSMLLCLMINFNLMKKFYFPVFHVHKNSKLNLLALFPKIQILECYSNITWGS